MTLEEELVKLRDLCKVKEALIQLQAKLVKTQGEKILDLEDQLAAANKVIAECREFVNTLAENEQATSTDRTISDLAFVIQSRG